MKKLLVLAVISGTVYGAWNVLGGDGDDDPVTAVDRLWIERLPRSERDTINVFVSISDDSIGVFQAGSRWRGAYELFQFEANGDQLQIVYPQTGERERVTAKVSACGERGMMDYCLDLEGSSRGVKRYYSMKGWEIDGVEAIDAKLKSLR